MRASLPWLSAAASQSLTTKTQRRQRKKEIWFLCVLGAFVVAFIALCILNSLMGKNSHLNADRRHYNGFSGTFPASPTSKRRLNDPSDEKLDIAEQRRQTDWRLVISDCGLRLDS
jgi:hypothetical protein